LGFFGHNFDTRNARKSIKGSKDSYNSLESNEALSQNIDTLDCPMIFIKLTAKHIPLMTSSTKNPKPKTYIFLNSKLPVFTSL